MNVSPSLALPWNINPGLLRWRRSSSKSERIVEISTLRSPFSSSYPPLSLPLSSLITFLADLFALTRRILLHYLPNLLFPEFLTRNYVLHSLACQDPREKKQQIAQIRDQSTKVHNLTRIPLRDRQEVQRKDS